MTDPLISSRPRLRLYLRVSEIVSETQDCSAKLALEAKPVHRVLPLKRIMFAVADEPNYSRPLLVNPDFSHLTANQTIPKTCAGTVSFVDMERLEKCARSLLEGNSHALWLVSGLLSQLKADSFSPSDPSLLAIPIGDAIWFCRCSFFFSSFFFFFSATILSGPYLWNRCSQRLQIECAAWSCGLVVHYCLPSNLLCYFFIFLFFLFFFLSRFCPGHISGTVTRRDSKFSVLLGPAV